ncbi:MAG: ankyrin repeat domain-containing protein [Pseudomonadota bacterium]|nr:ankyrin repeat domain-containing protein [Pseudomonadota bacterium]
MPTNKKKPNFSWCSILENTGTVIANDINKRDKDGQTLLHAIAITKYVPPASIQNIQDLLLSLSPEKKQEALEKNNNHGLTPLGCAIQQKNLDSAIKLMSLGCDLTNCKQNGKWLHHVIMHADEIFIIQNVLPLYRAAAIIQKDTVDTDNQTPLNIAVSHRKNLTISRALLAIGADPNKSCNAQHNILTQAIETNNDNIILDYITRLNAENAHKYNADQINALSLASVRCQATIVRMILQQYPQPHSVNSQGENTLHIMAKTPQYNNAHDEIARMLIHTGMRCDQKCNNGDTPVMVALKHGKEKFALTLLDYSDIYQKNKNQEHALNIAIYMKAKEAAQKILNIEITSKNRPYSLAHKTCPLPSHFHDIIKPEIEQKLGNRIGNIRNITPVSLCVLMYSLDKDICNILHMMITSQHQKNQKFDDDPSQFAIDTNQLELSLLLAKFNIFPKEPITNATEKASTIQVKSTNGIIRYNGYQNNLEQICRIESALKEKNIPLATTLIYSIPLNYFPTGWASQLWYHFGNHFLLLCLEHINSQLAFESLDHCLRQGKISAFHVLDDFQLDQESSISLRNSINALLLSLEKDKLNIDRPGFEKITFSKEKRQKRLKEIGFNFTENQEKPQRPEYTPSLVAELPTLIQAYDLSDPDSESYKYAYAFWQQVLLKKNNLDVNDEKNLSIPLVELFLYTLEQGIIDLLFDEHLHEPSCILQGLIIIHTCSCPDKRASIMEKIRLFLDTPAPNKRSLFELLSEKIKIRNPLEKGDTQEDSYHIKNARKEKVSTADVLRIAALINQKYIDFQQEKHARTLYVSILNLIIQAHGLFDDLVDLDQWICLHDSQSLSCIQEVNIQKSILAFLAEKYQNPINHNKITQIIRHLAYHLGDDLVACISQDPTIMFLLTQPEHLYSIPVTSHKLRATLQSYVAYLVITNQRKLNCPSYTPERILQAFEETITEQNQNNKELMKRIKELEKNEYLKTKEQRLLQEKSDNQEQKIQKMHAQLSEARQSIETENQSAIEYKNHMESIQKEKEELTVRIHDQEKEIAKLRETTRRQYDEEHELQTKYENMLQTIEQYKKEVENAERKNKKNVESLAHERKNWQDAQEKKNQQLVQDYTNQLTQQNNSYQKLIATLQEKNQEATEKVQQVQNQLQEKIDELKKQHTDEIASLTREHAHVTSKIHIDYEKKIKNMTLPKTRIHGNGSETEMMYRTNHKNKMNTAKHSQSNPHQTNYKKSSTLRHPEEIGAMSMHLAEQAFISNINQQYFSNQAMINAMTINNIQMMRNLENPQHILYLHANIESPSAQTLVPLTKFAEICSTINGIQNIQWCGTTATEYARTSWLEDSNHMQTLLYNYNEDIDIRIETKISTDTLIANIQKRWPTLVQTSIRNIGHFDKVVLRDPQSKLIFDIQIHRRLSNKNTPDRIVWTWQSTDSIWLLNTGSLSLEQKGFLYCHPTFNQLANISELYSAFWAFHQVVKHHGLRRNTQITHHILQRILQDTTHISITKILAESLKHFSNTPYWYACMEVLLFYLTPLTTYQTTVICRYLLPPHARFPHTIDRNSIPDINSIHTTEDFYSVIKSIWIENETNTALLHEKEPINWNEVPQYGEKSSQSPMLSLK